MKIHGTQPTNPINPYNRQNDPKASVGKKGKRDEVSISAEAQQMLNANSVGQADDKAEKLRELKRSVATGTYYVEARKIAEKLWPYLK